MADTSLNISEISVNTNFADGILLLHRYERCCGEAAYKGIKKHPKYFPSAVKYSVVIILKAQRVYFLLPLLPKQGRQFPDPLVP